MTINTLHVFGQPFEHGDCYIVGDIDALYALKDAINDALGLGKAKFNSFTNDGEGFTVHVIKASQEQTEQLMLPYSDRSFYEKNGIEIPDDVIKPWDLVK